MPVSVPGVSVIIATHNRARFVVRAVESVLAQTYRDFELIVIDDGSTDTTREILSGCDGRLCYIHQEQKGRSEARNAGVRAAGGEYIAFLDSDDIWLPHKLEKQLFVMESNPNLGLVHSLTEVIDEQGQPLSRETASRFSLYQRAIDRGYTYEAMSLRCVMFLSTVMVRRACFNDVGLFDPCIPACEDWDWYLRFAIKYQIAILATPLVAFRFHEGHTPAEELIEGRIKTCLKHLDLLETLADAPFRNTARRNFYLNLAAAHYMAGNLRECRLWTTRAARIDPSVFLTPEVALHFLLSWTSAGVLRGLRAVRGRV